MARYHKFCNSFRRAAKLRKHAAVQPCGLCGAGKHAQAIGESFRTKLQRYLSLPSGEAAGGGQVQNQVVLNENQRTTKTSAQDNARSLQDHECDSPQRTLHVNKGSQVLGRVIPQQRSKAGPKRPGFRIAIASHQVAEHQRFQRWVAAQMKMAERSWFSDARCLIAKVFSSSCN